MKGKKTDLTNADCAIARSLQVIGDWWSLLIIRESFRGIQRFGEFKKSLGLANNILSARLKKLVEKGILKVDSDDGASTYNRYVLTDKGEGLHVVLIALWQWGEQTYLAPGELTSTIVDVQKEEPLAKLAPMTQDGRIVGPRDFKLKQRAVD